MVKRFSKKFLKALRNIKSRYNEARNQVPLIEDPNHQNVIEISSEDGDYEDESEEERSGYFANQEQDEAVRRFNAKCM